MLEEQISHVVFHHHTRGNPLTLTRREFLKLAALTAAGVAVAACSPQSPNTSPARPLPAPESLAPTNDFLKLGQEQELPLERFGIKYTPDGHITYIDLPNNVRRFFISGNEQSYLFEGKTGMTLASVVQSYDKRPIKVWGLDNKVTYRNGYSAITSIIKTDNKNPNHLLATVHNEQHAGGPSNFTASVGLIESTDGGINWNDKGVLIKGSDAIPPGEHVSGAGEPCSIVKDEYVYIYYVDWASQKKIQKPDQIHLTRAVIKNDGSLGQIEHFTDSGFKTEFQNKELKPVIPVPQNIPKSNYSALPSVSFNKHLNKYLCVFETDVGFCAATSDDAINWNEAKMIAKFPTVLSQRKGDGRETWYSYPTLLSETEPNDQITGPNGILYCAKQKPGSDNHQLFTLPFSLS